MVALVDVMKEVIFVARGRRRQRAGVRLNLEPLEDRMMPSAGVAELAPPAHGPAHAVARILEQPLDKPKNDNGVKHAAQQAATPMRGWEQTGFTGWWFVNGNVPGMIVQHGKNLLFFGSNNQVVAATLVDDTHIVSKNHKLTATVSSDAFGVAITWSNGTVWSQTHLAGAWYNISGQETEISQLGNSLTLTDAAGATATGYFRDSTHVVISAWNLTGTISNSPYGLVIEWSDGTAWAQSPLALQPQIGGTWYADGVRPTSIIQTEIGLTFIDQDGQATEGIFLDKTHVLANGSVGTLVTVDGGMEIHWDNGTTWTQTQISLPDVSGQWFAGEDAAQVEQDGANLTFTNSAGDSSTGYFLDATHVFAADWNLTGTITASEDGPVIEWSDGSAWTRTPVSSLPQIGGTWYFLGFRPAEIVQDGTSLTFFNENGQSSPGYFIDATHVYATLWNITGTLVMTDSGLELHWDNGTWGSQNQYPAPDLAGQWWNRSLPTQIEQDGTELTLINEWGFVSTGCFLDATHVLANPGNVIGTLITTSTGQEIRWSNGVIWHR